MNQTNIDMEEATIVAYECASRFYKITQENEWGELSEARVSKGVKECQFTALYMMEFLLNDSENTTYNVRASALKSAVTILEGVISRSKIMGNAPQDQKQMDFVNACKKDLNAHALCDHAQTIAVQMQNLQAQSVKPGKKMKM